MAVRGAAAGVDQPNFNDLLFVLRGANMQSTADQAFSKVFGGSNYTANVMIARQRSGAASVACQGGIYDAAGKTGNQIVISTQSWVTLASGVIVSAALNVPTILLANTPILSLTTGSTAACTADIYIFGVDLS